MIASQLANQETALKSRTCDQRCTGGLTLGTCHSTKSAGSARTKPKPRQLRQGASAARAFHATLRCNIHDDVHSNISRSGIVNASAEAPLAAPLRDHRASVGKCAPCEAHAAFVLRPPRGGGRRTRCGSKKNSRQACCSRTQACLAAAGMCRRVVVRAASTSSKEGTAQSSTAPALPSAGPAV